METFTLKKLQKYLTNFVKEHPELADKKILISDDDEGNGYHQLFFGITSGQDAVECLTNCACCYDENDKYCKEYIILG